MKSGKAFENEYISRREAIKARKRSCNGNCLECEFAIEGDSWCKGEVFVVDLLRIPTADVRHVVLCRDCDCWNDWDSAGRESLGNYVCSCAHWTVEDGAVFYTKPTDFCSYGEKREEATNGN